jgi:DNA-binding response OmpR family regulator
VNNDEKTRRLLLLTDDNFIAEALGTYMHRDNIQVDRVTAVGDVVQAIAGGADGVVIDIAKRDITGDVIMNLTGRAQRWEIPVFIMTAQPRRDLSDFAAVVRATDVLSKTESMTAIAARIRLCMRTPMKADPKKLVPSEQLSWALA